VGLEVRKMAVVKFTGLTGTIYARRKIKEEWAFVILTFLTQTFWPNKFESPLSLLKANLGYCLNFTWQRFHGAKVMFGWT